MIVFSLRLHSLLLHSKPRVYPTFISAMLHTAGIVVIGDEILKGQTVDSNSSYMTKELFNLGVKVEKITVVGDHLEKISNEVKKFSEQYHYVFTSGGIGPTHDDITVQGVARAFGEDVQLNATLSKLVRSYFGDVSDSSPEMKLAHVPKSAKLNFGTGERRARYPVVSVNNVYILPGVPSLLKKGFAIIKPLLTRDGMDFHVRELYLNVDEFVVADILTKFNENHKKEIILGSYPKLFNSYYKVKLTIQSTNELKVVEAAEKLKSMLPADCLVHYSPSPIETVHKDIDSLLASDHPLSTKISQSLTSIEKCFKDFDKPGDVCISFNGGKDATVLLHLVHAYWRRRFTPATGPQAQLQALYIRHSLPFVEKEDFIWKCKDSYNLDLIAINNQGNIQNYKQALEKLKEVRPSIQAIIMGTRQTDPNAVTQSEFCLTDVGWPKYMRVNPILTWNYHDVWKFIRHFCLPYCLLYDKGYTSLGSADHTFPNEELQYFNEQGKLCYKPAYNLVNVETERCGRKR